MQRIRSCFFCELQRLPSTTLEISNQQNLPLTERTSIFDNLLIDWSQIILGNESGAKKSQRLDMATRRNFRYTPLATDEDDYTGDRNRPFDPRFDYTPKALDRIPWKSIVLALFLLFLGMGLLFLSYFIFTGHMGGDRSQAYGLLVLGFLSFLPGFYETRIAYYAWRGIKGYRFSAIPDY